MLKSSLILPIPSETPTNPRGFEYVKLYFILPLQRVVHGTAYGGVQI
jgi:hypothetical protein